MTNLLCIIGLHRWWPEDKNYFTATEAVFRTYMRCRRCRKWGKNVFFEREVS